MVPLGRRESWRRKAGGPAQVALARTGTLRKRAERERSEVNMTNTAVGYCRVSTAKQAGEDKVSLAEQQRAITALAASLNLQVERWFIDAGASGGDHNRP